MTQAELNSKVRELQKLKEISEQLVTWQEYHTTRLDKKRLEAELGDLSKYQTTTTYKSFHLRKKKNVAYGI